MFNSGLSLILAQRLWQGFAGLITVLMIGLSLNHEQQGWYYTFLSLAALYSVFEMGLTTVLIQFTAHMFVKLHWLPQGRFAGEGSSIFASFVCKSVKVYAYLALIFLFISLSVGFYIFTHRTSHVITLNLWVWPWLLLVLVTASNMLILPFLAIVEGSGDIAEVYKVKLVQGVIGAIACWLVLFSGGGLWATLMMPLSGILVGVFWLLKKRYNMVKILFEKVSDAGFSWKNEILPLQWRIGLNWISIFMMSQLATPILFYYQNPVVAGQMGLSLTIANMIAIVAQSWIAQRIPLLSQAVAKKEWHILDHLFKKDLKHSLIVLFAGVFVVMAAHRLISHTSYITRVLSFWSFAGLLGFILFYHIANALSAQLRSFKREPLAWVSFTGAMLILPGSIYAAMQFSASGVILVMLGVQALVVFPLSYLLWRKLNQEWRSAGGA